MSGTGHELNGTPAPGERFDAEALSALLDGEATELERARLLRELLGDDLQARQHWHRWHVIGSTLRGEAVVAGPAPLLRLRTALAEEPPIAAPLPEPVDAGAREATPGNWGMRGRGLALAASVAAAVVLASALLEPEPGVPGAPLVAAQPSAPVVESQPVAIRQERGVRVVPADTAEPAHPALSPRTRAYMLEHVDSCALAGPAATQLIRAVAFTGADPARAGR